MIYNFVAWFLPLFIAAVSVTVLIRIIRRINKP